MSKYYFFEKVKGINIIKDISTNQLELVDDDTLKEGRELGLVQDYNIVSEVVRRKLVDDFTVFSCNSYEIKKEGVNYILYAYAEVILLYIPTGVKRVLFEELKHVKSIVLVSNGLEFLDFAYFDIERIDFTYFNSSKLTSLASCFRGCKYLREIIWGNFDTSNITSMSNMFSECYSLRRLDLSNFNMKNVIDIKQMFSNCKRLSDIKLFNLYGNNTKKTLEIDCMFLGCTYIENLDLSMWNFEDRAITYYGLFKFCNKLKVIDMRHFIFKELEGIDMFFGCYSLEKVIVSKREKENFNYKDSGTTNFSCDCLELVE